jgi:four helix bundle protein
MNTIGYLRESKTAYGFQSYENMQLWQKGITVVNDVYSICELMPTSEGYTLRSKIKKAAITIPSNIFKGWTRKSNNELYNHLTKASNSVTEIITQLQAINNLYKIDSNVVKSECQDLTNIINAFLLHIEAEQQNKK